MITAARLPIRLISTAFSGASRLRLLLYESGILKTRALPHPVISVGNLSVGGTGKTPLVAFLAEEVASSGLHPVILSRGYKGTARHPLIVCDRSYPTCSAEACGDEPYELALRLPQATVVVGKDRWAAGMAVAHAFERAAFILDDGFQHLPLARDLDLVAIDLTKPPWNDAPLPAGRLREPMQALSRADAVVLTRVHLSELPEESARDEVARWNPSIPVFAFSHRFCGVSDLAGNSTLEMSSLSGAKAVVMAAIGNPEQFTSDLRRAGITIAAECLFRDHHKYSTADLEKVDEARRRSGADLIITTAKDAVRLHSMDCSELPVKVVQIQAVCHDIEAFRSLLRQKLQRPGGGETL